MDIEAANAETILLVVLIIAVAVPARDGPAPGETDTEHSTSDSSSGAATTREVQRLFDDLLTAFRTADTSPLRSTMPNDLAMLCPEQSMTPWLEENGSGIQAFEVASVFVDARDPDRGVAQLALVPKRDEAVPLQVESARWFPITMSPFPLQREEGSWKAGYPVPQERPSCPYQLRQSVPPEPGVGPGYPDIQGLDLDMWDDPFSYPEPDGFGSTGHTSFSYQGTPAGTSTIWSSTVQATDLTAGELATRYRERLARPGWDIREQEDGAGTSWFTWSVRDGDGHLWHGVLTVSAAGKGRQWVSLFLHSPELQQP